MNSERWLTPTSRMRPTKQASAPTITQLVSRQGSQVTTEAGAGRSERTERDAGHPSASRAASASDASPSDTAVVPYVLPLRCRGRVPCIIRQHAGHDAHGDGLTGRDLAEELAAQTGAGGVATLVRALVIRRKAPRAGWPVEKAILHPRVKGRAIIVLVHHGSAPVTARDQQRPASATPLGQPAVASDKGRGMGGPCQCLSRSPLPHGLWIGCASMMRHEECPFRECRVELW